LKYTIAIQPDDYGPGDAASPIWASYLQEAGHKVRMVNVYSADILDQLRDCHGFMWRHAHFSNLRQIARRLLPVVERELGLVVYPDQNTCWHYDDKIAQSYLLQALGIPIPKTWVWYDGELAKKWARTAQYPMVFKLWGGAGSVNVLLVNSFEEAELYIDKLFSRGVNCALDLYLKEPWPWGRKRIRSAAKLLLKGIPPNMKLDEMAWDLHKNYILFQEFLLGNEFDTRVAVIGNRAFCQRRFNRPNDFRASGSGNFDTDPTKIDLEAVRLAFHVAERLKTQSIAIDCLRRGNERVVAEISYTYVVWIGYKCPGHWELSGDPYTGKLIWREGRMYREEAQVADFLARLESHYKGLT
jgi:glutathione synthase/RimK-type ligase-like ATP-grasp enzyme